MCIRDSVGQHIHGWGRSCSHQMCECPAEVLLFPTGEHRDVRHGLSARWVVIENDQYPLRRGHGGGDSCGADRHLGRETCEQVSFTYQRRLSVDAIGWLPARIRRKSSSDTSGMSSGLVTVNGCSAAPVHAAHSRPRHMPPWSCLLYTSPSPRDRTRSRMPSSA